MLVPKVTFLCGYLFNTSKPRTKHLWMTLQTSISHTSWHYLQPTCSRTLPPTKEKRKEGALLPLSVFPLSEGGCYTQASLPKVLHVHVYYLLEPITRCLLKAEALYILLLKVTINLPKMLVQLFKQNSEGGRNLCYHGNS